MHSRAFLRSDYSTPTTVLTLQYTHYSTHTTVHTLHCTVGVGRYIVFDLKSSFCDIQEDIVSVSEYCFRHFPNSLIFLKLHFSISCCIVSFLYLYFLYFSRFSLKMMLIVSNCAYLLLFFLFFCCWKMMFLVLYCFPFSPISRLKFCLVSHFPPISCLKFFLAFHFPVHFLYLIVFKKSVSPTLLHSTVCSVRNTTLPVVHCKLLLV